jgi:hypothetical protein
VKATITAGPPVAPKTIFVQPGAGGDGSSPLTPASFARAFEAAETLQQATPNLPVILKVVSVNAATNPEPLPVGRAEVKAINNGTITIQPEPAVAGGLAGVQLGANLTIGSGVTVNDIKINLNGSNLTIEGNASKLIVADKNAPNVIEQVTVAAGATVTDSTIILNSGAVGNNQSDQLIVKGRGILKNSRVVANANAAKTAIIRLAGTLDGVTFSCKIEADFDNANNEVTGNGVCIEATAAGAQIINNSRVDFDANATGTAQTTPRVVDAGTNGVTIIGSVLKRIDNSDTKVFAVQHGGGALVVQNSTIDLNNTTNDDSRAVNSTAASGSIILTGNVFEGYNNANNNPVVDIRGALGRAPQQIANNQFRITNPATVGIRSVGASSDLRDLYATGSGNTFGVAGTKVTN